MSDADGWRSAAAFLLVVGRPSSTATPDPSPSSTDLGFTPTSSMTWSATGAAVALWCWAEGPPAWVVDGTGAAASVGDLRRLGSSEVGVDLLRTGASQVPGPSEDLRGVFAAAVLSTDGDGFVVTDVIGHRLLYWGERGGMFVLATRAALVAEVLSGAGRPARDRMGVCWLPFTTYRVGESTGFVDVNVAAPGARLRIVNGRPAWERTAPFIVGADDPFRQLSLPERAEVAIDDVGRGLRTLLAQPAERHVLRLTGGKDSRVVLAAAARAGLDDRLTYETIGPPDLADVQVAAGLCGELGLPHEAPFLELASGVPFEEKVRRFVERTAAMVNGWDVSADPGSPGDLCMTGICGELLRSSQPLPEELRSADRIQEAFGPDRIGTLGLLRPDVELLLREELLERLATEPSTEADPLDRAQAHFSSYRMRFTRLGAREELHGARNAHPLYSPVGLRAAMSMDSCERQSDVLIASMMRLGSERLVTYPFSDGRWDRRARRSLGLDDPPEEQREQQEPRAKPKALVATLSSDRRTARVDFLRGAFADRSNEVWELLERPRAIAATERFAALSTRARQELFGAATAALWLERP